MVNIFQDLNEKQKESVMHHAGPLLVRAGPGTGKTTVITRRIAYLIREYQVNPESILALTFTDKASRVMQDRLSSEELIEEHASSQVEVSTFHSFCRGVLQEHGSNIGLSKNFMVCNDEIQAEILIECLQELNLVKLNTVSTRLKWLRQDISYFKARTYDPEAPALFPDSLRGGRSKNLEYARNCEPLFHAYQRKLEEQNLVDFEDLLLKTIELFENVPTVQEIYHNAIYYTLVDEYQDVNSTQYRILQLLCPSLKHNLMVVADEDQAIYGWRGADPLYIEKFKSDFNPKVVELDEHYRCTETILRSAEKVLSKDTGRSERVSLKTNSNPESDRIIHHYSLRNRDKECERIIWLLGKLVDDTQKYSHEDIAILYRNHEFADDLAVKLLETGIKFQRVQPPNSVQNRNYQGIISYLNVLEGHILDNPEPAINADALELAINFPQKRIDNLTWVRLKWLAQRKGVELVEFLKNLENYPEDIGPLTRRNIRQFWTEIKRLSVEIRDEKINQKIQKVLAALESSRSPYRREEVQIIEEQPEVPQLSAAIDVLHTAIVRSEPIQILTNYGIDEYCAAHIIHQTLKTYLQQNISIQFMPHNTNRPMLDPNLVHILIGPSAELNTGAVEAKTILIGNQPVKTTDLIQLETNDIHSITALKLCQHLLGRFENANIPDLVIYDLETRGVNTESAKIVEIAAHRVTAENGEVEKYQQLVKLPKGYLPKSSTRVHQITEDMVENAPHIEDVLPEFSKFIQDSILIGHNAIEFDNPILERHLKEYLEIELTNPCYDTLVTTRTLYPRKSFSLEALAEHFDIPHGTLHRAEEDVEVTGKIFKELTKNDFQRCCLRSLTEFLPFIGCAILDKTQELCNNELTETGAFLNAARRFVQTCYTQGEFTFKNLMPLESRDKEKIVAFIDELRGTTIPDFPEDTNWKIHCTDLRNTVNTFKQRSKTEEVTGFLAYQDQVKSIDDIEEENEQVTLMTLHAAKGTEFPIVIIIGMGEDTSNMKEEERRLFYVGMTRGKKRLYFTSIRDSDAGSSARLMFSEIPSDYINRRRE